MPPFWISLEPSCIIKVGFSLLFAYPTFFPNKIGRLTTLSLDSIWRRKTNDADADAGADADVTVAVAVECKLNR